MRDTPSRTVVLLGTLDTKGPEYAFVGDRLRDAGLTVTLVDVGVLGEPGTRPDVSAAAVAAASGTTLEALRAASVAGDRAGALDTMARGASTLIDSWRAEGRCDGVMGLGGSGGTAIVSAVLRGLPIGVPKLLVSTMTAGDTRPYVGTRDLMLLHPVTDIQGVNRISRRVLTNAANAMAGMVLLGPSSADQSPSRAGAGRPLVAITMMGVTTPCGQAAQARLEAAGFETIVFHANGSGGRAMEELVDSGFIDGVLDLTTNELTSELFDGILQAGPTRLTAAGRRAVPQVVAPGALEVINFGPLDEVPRRFLVPGRRHVMHSEVITSVHVSEEEASETGALFAARVSGARGPTSVLLPLGGCSKYQLPGGPFIAPEIDEALFSAIRAGLRDDIPVIEVASNLNEAPFAEAAVTSFLALWEERGHAVRTGVGSGSS